MFTRWTARAILGAIDRSRCHKILRNRRGSRLANQCLDSRHSGAENAANICREVGRRKNCTSYYKSAKVYAQRINSTGIIHLVSRLFVRNARHKFDQIFTRRSTIEHACRACRCCREVFLNRETCKADIHDITVRCCVRMNILFYVHAIPFGYGLSCTKNHFIQFSIPIYHLQEISREPSINLDGAAQPTIESCRQLRVETRICLYVGVNRG